MPPHEHGPASRLGRPHSFTPSSTTQPEIDESLSQADHAHPPTPVDNDHYSTPQTSRSPSAMVESTPVTEYQEWPFQGFLKRTRIFNQKTYNLEFAFPRTSEHFHLSLHSEVLGYLLGVASKGCSLSPGCINTEAGKGTDKGARESVGQDGPRRQDLSRDRAAFPRPHSSH
jgi:hypothetical protein